MFSPLLGADLREDGLAACYFFYGAEIYLAEQFVDQMKDMLAASSGEDFRIERFYLDESRWMDIIDTARTAPFLFQSWRVLAVTMPERRSGSDKSGGRGAAAEDGEGKSIRFLSETDQKIIRAYFADPPGRTVLIVVLPGSAKKNDSVVRFFSSLPKTAVTVKEIRPLYPKDLIAWADRKAQGLGKSLTSEAKARLVEIVGSDLRLLSNEIEKLAVFVGDKRVIGDDDVNQAVAWLRSYEIYALDDALTAADFERGVTVLGSLFSEGAKPEMLISRLAAFFRNVLAAQTWLREKSRTREEIFQEFFPYIQKAHFSLYEPKFRGFFSVVDGLSRADLASLLRKLQQADLKLKTTDADARTVLEVFLKEYCLLRGKGKATSRG